MSEFEIRRIRGDIGQVEFADLLHVAVRTLQDLDKAVVRLARLPPPF